MVTEVKRYVANDGKEFTSPVDASRHEVAVAFLRSIAPDASRQVYDAIVKAQKLGWTLVAPNAGRAERGSRT